MSMIGRTTKVTNLIITILPYGIILYFYFYVAFCDCFEVDEADVDGNIQKCLDAYYKYNCLQFHTINVKSAMCDRRRNFHIPTIIIPNIPENENGEIYFTSSHPIRTFSFQGYQLSDYMNITLVRTASSLKNKWSYNYTVGLSLSKVNSTIDVRIGPMGLSGVMSGDARFRLFRPGESLFFANLRSYPFQENGTYYLPVNQFLPNDSRKHSKRLQKMEIPCVASQPNNINITLSTVPADMRKEFVSFYFYRDQGFSVSYDKDKLSKPITRYVCKASRVGTNEVETVVFEVVNIPEPIVEIQPETDVVYLYNKLRYRNARLVCSSHEETSSFAELLMKRNLTIEGYVNGNTVTTYPLISENEYFYDPGLSVKYGDNGYLQCRKPCGHVLMNWTIQSIDPIKTNPDLQFIKLSEQTVACKSEKFLVKDIRLQSVFCQGELECSLNQFCFNETKTGRVKSNWRACNGKTILGSSCSSNQSNSVCLQLSQDHSDGAGLHSQGMVQCSVGKLVYSTNYFIGFDKILYLNWKTANESALINISTPNTTLMHNQSYLFVCKASKFLSDGILQWGIKEANQNEVYLEEDQVQDFYRRYATEQDYRLYTVRESMIMLNYSSGFDVICRVPVWNSNDWKRGYKQINYAQPAHPGKSSLMLIIILSCASGVIILLLGVVLCVTWRWRKAKNLLRNLTEEEVEEFFHGNPEASSSESTSYLQAHELVNIFSYDRKFEIPREKLQIDMANVLGKGEFGTVCKGTVKGIRENVAVKFLKNKCDVDRFKGFLKELKIMIYIGNHENIVSLIGASTEKIRERTLYIVVEFCLNGSLEGYLRKYKSSFCRNLSKEMQPISNDGAIAITDLLKWSYQISNGMEHLACKKVIHADLAARNVLLDCKRNAKITDFGLSRRLYDYTQYVKRKREPLPWRWLSLESLRQLQFSTQSDVWSFGILLWEIFSLGDIPYPGLNWGPHFVRRLEDGLRMTKPSECPDKIFKLMLNCWKVSPEERPSFDVISQYFKNLLDSNDGNVWSDENENDSEPELDYLDIQYLSEDCIP